MLTLTRDESRILGVLVEKAQTTPGQYPLTLNSLTLGANQKNNRDPATNLSEDRVFDAIDSLRKKGLVRELMLSGSRVAKYRHIAREALTVTTEELVILAELLLRGPQSIGELRARATRMHPIDSLEAAQATVDGLIARPEPLIRELPPRPGTRAKRFAQLLCPDLHPLDHAGAGESEDDSGADFQPAGRASGVGFQPTGRTLADPALLQSLEDRITTLESEVRTLSAALERLSTALGNPTL